MSIIKGDLVTRALKMLGVADSITSPDPSEIADGLETLDSMVAEWENHGIRLGYHLAADGVAANPGDESGIADKHVMGVSANLAVNMAPLIGREAQPTIKSRAKLFYEGLFNIELTQRQSDPMMPTGSGNCHLGAYQLPDDGVITVENDGNLVI